MHPWQPWLLWVFLFFCRERKNLLFASAKNYRTFSLLLITYYFAKNPAALGKSEEVRGKK